MNELEFKKIESDITIVGLGSNKGKRFYQKSILEYLKNELIANNDPIIIDAFLTLLNNPECIDLIIKNNLTLEEIKELQINEFVYKIASKLGNGSVAKIISKIGYVSRLFNGINEIDRQIFISDIIRSSSNVVVIYAPEVFNKDRYSFDEKSIISSSLDTVDCSITRILNLNNNAKIFVLGLDKAEDENVQSYTEIFNSKLVNLCWSTGAVFINPDINFDENYFQVMARRILDNIDYISGNNIKHNNNDLSSAGGLYCMAFDLMADPKGNYEEIEIVKDSFARVKRREIWRT